MKKKILITITSCLVLAAIAAPYFFGLLLKKGVEQTMRDIQNGLSDARPVQLSTLYSRGWLSSDVQTDVRVNDMLVVSIKHHIVHGPWSYFGLGSVESKLNFSASAKPLIDQLFDGKEPLVVKTDFGFFSNIKMNIEAAPIVNKPMPPGQLDTILNWGGVRGGWSALDGQFRMNLTAPIFAIANKTRRVITVKDITMDGSGAYFNDNWDAATGKRWAGQQSINIGKLSFVAGDGAVISSTINFLADVKDVAGGKINYHMQLSLTNMEPPKQLLPIISNPDDKITFSFSLNGLPKKQIADLFSKVNTLQRKGIEPSRSLLEEEKESLIKAFLQGTPSIEFHSELIAKNGNTSADIVAKLDVAETSNDLNALLTNVENRLQITTDTTFANSLLDNLDKMRALPISKSDFIKNITKNDRFILKDKVFSGRFEYKKGVLYSHGRPDPELASMLKYGLMLQPHF